MRSRGNCPECRLRDVTHVVTEPDAEAVRLCKQCAWAYDFPAQIAEIAE
jgi:hypothetical protein